MITFESAINRLAERVSDRTQESRNVRLQRRNQVVDMYGVEFTRQGDKDRPATFYISISPDLIYFERFEFKVIIEGFKVPIAMDGGIRPAEVTVRPESLEITPTNLTPSTVGIAVNNQNVTGVPSSHSHTLTPQEHSHTISDHTHAIIENPHDHDTIPHTHSIVAGISFFDIGAKNFRIFIEGIDMTPYFKVQFPNDPWLNDRGGVFPNTELDNYDVLEAVAYMDPDIRSKILKPGYKKVEIEGDGIFTATLVNYLKYSHVNR